jgi:Putative zinc-finger
VDEKRTDLKDARPHVGLKRLTAYCRGALPEAEREAVQEHLSLCARCTGLLRELMSFEADAAGPADQHDGLEAPRREAWESLSRRLSQRAPQVPPAPAAAHGPTSPRPSPWLVYAAAAALLLAVAGLSVWSAVTIRQGHERLARLERKLAEREGALAATQRSLADAERRLDAVAALTSELAEMRRMARAPEARERTAAAHPVELAVSPRFALRGEESPDSLLRPGGTENPVRISAAADGFTVVLSLAGQPVYDEYRLELVDHDGKALWTGRRPGRALLGDAGTSISIHGLGPGLYRLRIAGLPPGQRVPLAEYLLAVQV